MRETSIVEVGELLELCSCSRKLCESWLQKLFNKNNYHLVQIHCIIKIMCQGFTLGCLQCLLVCTVQDRNFGCSAWFFIFFTGTLNSSDYFCTVFIYKLFIFPKFFRIFGVPEVWWMFRLLQTVLFKTDSVFDASFACFDGTINFYQWMKPWNLYYNSYKAKKYELVCNST